jgi:hypothetical protein
MGFFDGPLRTYPRVAIEDPWHIGVLEPWQITLFHSRERPVKGAFDFSRTPFFFFTNIDQVIGG